MLLMSTACSMRSIRGGRASKRALPVVALRRLLYEDPQSDRLRRTQAIAALMFQFCGMSFADLTHLEKSALDSNVLRYNRVKTKTPMSVEVLDSAKEMLDQLRNRQSPRPGCPDYLSAFFKVIRRGRMREPTVNTSPLSEDSTTA